MNASFQFDQAMAAWRSATSGAAQMHASHLDELETHLRDTYAELREIGLPEEEAFHLARRRLGDTELAAEFAKVHPDALWRERGKWMLCGLLGYQLFRGSCDACTLFLEWAATSFFPAPQALLCVYWASAVLMIGAVAWALVCTVRGRWRLSGSTLAPWVRRPAVLATLLPLLLLLRMIIDFVGARLALGIAGSSWNFASLWATKRYIDLAVTVAFAIMLGVAAAHAARHTRPPHHEAR